MEIRAGRNIKITIYISKIEKKIKYKYNYPNWSLGEKTINSAVYSEVASSAWNGHKSCGNYNDSEREIVSSL